MMRKLFTFLLFCMAMLVSAQIKKPTLMVIPADNWCSANGFMDTIQSNSQVILTPNYKRVLQSSADCYNVITKINTLMSDRNFPLKDLSAAIKSLNNESMMDHATSYKLYESNLDLIKKNAGPDIVLELNWQVNKVGPKKSITYSLAAKDAYTDKQVAGCQGTGTPSFAAELPLLLEEAVIANMDNFCSQLQAYFDDMMENGREVAVEVKVINDDSGIDLSCKYDGVELQDIIDDWFSDNTVKHMYNLSSGSENFIKFEQVRIPLFQENGRANDTRRWVRELSKMLQSKYQIPNSIDIRGLGKAVLLIGEK